MASRLVENERVKLLANAFNAIGLAFVIGGLVAPILAGQASGGRVSLGLLAFAVGAGLHLLAQLTLGRLQE